MLKTWVWFELGGKISMEDIKQDGRGVVELRRGKYRNGAHIDETVTYTMADKQNCVVRQSIPSLSATTLIYLNKFLLGTRILNTDNGATEFAIESNEHTHCTTEARGTFCMDQMHFRAGDRQTLERMKQALDLIFSKFCKLANRKTEPSVGTGWKAIVR